MFSKENTSSFFSLHKKVNANESVSFDRTQLGPQQPFIHFDLELTEEEQQSLQQLKIDSVSHYENYGDLEILLTELQNFILSLSVTNLTISLTVAKLATRIIHNVLAFTGQETAWITMRAFTPVLTFKEPRWHADRYDYPPTGEQLKAAITLKGPSTLFSDLTPQQRQNFDSIKHDREMLIKSLPKTSIVSAKPGEGTIFTIGAPHAPFHSEPDTNSDRLFLVLVPGSKEQIQNLFMQTPEQQIIPLLRSHGFYCYFVGPRLQDKFIASPYENTEIIVFKLLDKIEPKLLETIAEIITSNNKKMRTEIVTDTRTVLKITFPQGGFITINDISEQFVGHKNELSEDAIFSRLRAYADGYQSLHKFDAIASQSIQTTQEQKAVTTASSLPQRLKINAVIGKNTSGLFKPIQDPWSQTITGAKISLTPEKSFINFDLELTQDEKQSLESLLIDSASHYENYGDLEILPTEVSSFLNSLAESNSSISKTIAGLVQKLVQKIIAFTGQESVWVTMRAYLPVTNFKEPRWHADTYYYPPTGEQYKVAITLKGASTLFYAVSAQEREELEPIRNDKEALRKKIDNSKVVRARPYQGSIFIVGPSYAPIHSEPNIDHKRLFLSMIPGSKQQIKKLYEATPEHEITAPLLAHGYYCYFVGPRLQDKFVVSPYENTEIIVFKLLEKPEPNLLNNICSVINAHNPEIKSEILEEEGTALKFIFPKGAVIIVNDISSFILEQKYKINSEEDIYVALEAYAKKAASPVQTSKSAPTVNKYTINHISGRNTSGLFKPQPKATIPNKTDLNLDEKETVTYGNI